MGIDCWDDSLGSVGMEFFYLCSMCLSGDVVLMVLYMLTGQPEGQWAGAIASSTGEECLGAV